MMNDVPKARAVVEDPPDHRSSEESTSNFRIRQQEILAELGVLALQGTPLRELLAKTASLTSEGLKSEFCKVLEYQPKEARFLVTAGVGWGPDVIGVATVGADIESPAGYALITGKPVISNHLENEERFRTPELLAKHGIRRAMNVILQGDGSPYGVLEADIPVALFVNETITNSAKHAHADQKCEVWIDVVRNDETISVKVRDVGRGLPADFATRSQKSLGMRVITALFRYRRSA